MVFIKAWPITRQTYRPYLTEKKLKDSSLLCRSSPSTLPWRARACGFHFHTHCNPGQLAHECGSRVQTEDYHYLLPPTPEPLQWIPWPSRQWGYQRYRSQGEEEQFRELLKHTCRKVEDWSNAAINNGIVFMAESNDSLLAYVCLGDVANRDMRLSINAVYIYTYIQRRYEVTRWEHCIMRVCPGVVEGTRNVWCLSLWGIMIKTNEL